MGNITKVVYDTTRNTRIAQKVFKLVLTSLCDPQEYAHSFTREQKIAVLREAGHINGSQEMSGWFLEHGAELYEKDKEDDCNE